MAWRVLWSPMQPSKCKACNLSGLRKSIVRWQQIGAFWNRRLEMSITTESLWLLKRRVNITIHSFIYVLKLVKKFRKKNLKEANISSRYMLHVTRRYIGLLEILFFEIFLQFLRRKWMNEWMNGYIYSPF